jgi:uncharacterized protein (TIGR02996 family)
MRTFKFADDKSYKFWNIELEGMSFTVTYGRIGTKGQTQTKEFDTAEKAQKAYDKLIAEKLGKGYEETTAKAAAPTSTSKVLEKAIAADPDDLAAHAAYADWLSQQGDPRGEFIQVQLALEDPARSPKERKDLEKRERQLLAEHQEEWVGSWAQLVEKTGPEGRGQVGFPNERFKFIRGILAEAAIDEMSVECARAFVAAKPTRLLRRLLLGGWAFQEEGEYEAGDEPIPDDCYDPARFVFSKWPYFENLRVFQFGWTSQEEYGDTCDFQCHLGGEDIVGLIAKMPRLEELYLFASGVPTAELFTLKTLGNLRVLQVYHCWDYALEDLAANKFLNKLTHLLLHPKAAGAWSNNVPYISFDGVKSILHSPHLKHLTHLRFRMTDLGDRGCEEFVRSGILRRLKSLDLRHGCITDDGAHILAACPDVKRLDFLDIGRNQLTAKGIAELKSAVKSLDAVHQHQGESNVYGDDMADYFFQGDYE